MLFFSFGLFSRLLLVPKDEVADANGPKLLLHLLQNILILDQRVQLPCNSSIFAPNQISLKQTLDDIRGEIRQVADGSGDNAELTIGLCCIDILHQAESVLQRQM